MDIRIKPLEWEDGEARTAFGSAYTVHRRADGMYEAVGCGSFMEGPHETRDAAKAAAQADYERRILSAIAHPVQPGWRQEHLDRFVEALCAEDIGDPLRASGPCLETVAKRVLDYVFRPLPAAPQPKGE